MANTSLSRYLRKEGGRFLTNFLAPVKEPLLILDVDGRRLAGTVDLPHAEHAGALESRMPILHDGGVVGWVTGLPDSQSPMMLAELLMHLLRSDDEKRSLANEVLDKYRELHLLYRLAERLITSPQPEVIGQVALNEVISIIQVTSGMVILTHADQEKPQTIAQVGCDCRLKPEAFGADRLVGRVIRNASAELGNHLPAEDYFTGWNEHKVSLLCAPLKTENTVVGIFLLIGEDERAFNAGDLKLLNAIALQTAPAIEIAHLHQMELKNAWLERDLQTARRVQAGLLPSQMPIITGWDVAAFWRPARVVSGDLYDFIYLPEGKLGLVVADVTDKGVPAALLMANARSVLRGVAASAGGSGWDSPGRVLAQVNAVLSEEMPMDMFVTCLLVILDTRSGHLRFANAGHNLPYLRTAQGIVELRATGLPLGLFTNIEYEEKEAFLENGDSLLMYSDGLVEAHNPERVMFGSPRLRELLSDLAPNREVHGQALIEHLIERLEHFTGPGWEQEDDITMISVTRRC